MSLNFKKIQILSDFNLNFEMFNLSKKIQKNLSKLLNINIIFQFVNFNRPNQKYNAEIYWGTRPNNTLIKKIYGLKWIHMGSVGVDKLDIQMLKKKNIFLTNSYGINTDQMVNLITLYLIDTSRRQLFFKFKTKSRKKYEKLFKNSKDLSEQKICILGYGKISKQLSNVLDLLNVKHHFYSSRKFKSKRIINNKDLLKNLGSYDTIINLLSGEKKNINFINSTRFKKMKKDINLILVGRTNSVNLGFIYQFLKKNKNSSCYIDALPSSKNNNIFNKVTNLKNVHHSPHIGGYFRRYWEKQLLLFKKNIILYINKKKLINQIY